MPSLALLLILLILEVVTQTLPDAVVGRNYLAKLQAKGGTPPYSWAIQQTPLPAGLTLNPATGEISGVPRSAAPDGVRFTAAVTDSASPPATVYWNMTLRVAQPLVLVTRALPQAQSGNRYQVQLQARGGRLPLRWETVEGTPPPGLRLDPNSGLLSGVPTEGGEFNFAIRLSDSSNPPQRETYNFVARFLSPLAVRWKNSPHVERGGIFGSLEAANGTDQDFDLTVIVVAVNEVGKSFTLGYHKFLLARGTASRELLFGFSLPRGAYTAHADAVAEVPPRTIYRARLQQAALRVEDSR